MAKIIIYSKTTCPACVMAKDIFNQKGVEYKEVLLDGKPEDIKNLTARTGIKTVPQIFINGEFIGGCSDLINLDREHKLDTLLQI